MEERGSSSRIDLRSKCELQIEISGATGTDSLRLDICAVLGPESASRNAYNGPRCGDVSPVSDGLLLGEVTLLILAEMNCSETQG